jgi:hypothetical protein
VAKDMQQARSNQSTMTDKRDFMADTP